MDINISRGIRISSDEHCWKLERRRNYKGNTRWEAFKYFTSFGRALEEAGQLEIRTSPAQDVAEAIEDVRRICARISGIFEPEFQRRPTSNERPRDVA